MPNSQNTSAKPKDMFYVGTYPDLPPKYKLEKLLGEGAFSSVYKAKNKETGEVVAIKVITKSNLTLKQLANINNEMSIMNTLSNKGTQCVNVLRLLEAVHSSEHCFLVVEYCDGGEIFNKIIEYTYFSEQLARHVFLQLLDAIRFLHANSIVHRDIKPENLLFNRIPHQPRLEAEFRLSLRDSDDLLKRDEGRFEPGVGGGQVGVVKLADFGLAKQLKFEATSDFGIESNLKTPCGTAGYTAPEVIHCGDKKRRFRSNTLKSNFYLKLVDIWLLGCFLYTILCGFPPFYDENHDVLTHKILTADYVFLKPWWDEISADAKDLISKMLVINPEERITLDEIYQHPWLASAEPLKQDSYFGDVEEHEVGAEQDAGEGQIAGAGRIAGELSVGQSPARTPGDAIKQVFNNPAMLHVNLTLLANYRKNQLHFDELCQQHGAERKFPRTPNPVNFKDVFALSDEETEAPRLSDSLVLLVASRLNDCALSLMISGLNGDFKFALNMSDSGLFRRRSSVRSGHAHA